MMCKQQLPRWEEGKKEERKQEKHLKKGRFLIHALGEEGNPTSAQLGESYYYYFTDDNKANRVLKPTDQYLPHFQSSSYEFWAQAPTAKEMQLSPCSSMIRLP